MPYGYEQQHKRVCSDAQVQTPDKPAKPVNSVKSCVASPNWLYHRGQEFLEQARRERRGIPAAVCMERATRLGRRRPAWDGSIQFAAMTP